MCTVQYITTCMQYVEDIKITNCAYDLPQNQKKTTEATMISEPNIALEFLSSKTPDQLCKKDSKYNYLEPSLVTTLKALLPIKPIRKIQ